MHRSNLNRRSYLTENMDLPDCAESRLFSTLDQFSAVNRYFTRYRHILTGGVIRHMQREPARCYRLADLGSGGCDVSRWLICRCRMLGLRLKIRAIERDCRILRYASERNAGFPEIKLVNSDALDCSRWGDPDFVFANHLLHHLTDAGCVHLLRALSRSSIKSYMLTDIVRSRASEQAFRLIAGLLFRGSFVYEDGLTSIRRSFTPAELHRLIERSCPGLKPEVRFLFPARFFISGGALQ